MRIPGALHFDEFYTPYNLSLDYPYEIGLAYHEMTHVVVLKDAWQTVKY